jgi:hypothetical protein
MTALELIAAAFARQGAHDIAAELVAASAELDAYRALLDDALAQSAAEQERLS